MTAQDQIFEDQVFTDVINKIFEDNAEELNAEEAKKGEQTLDKEHAEKWVKDILGDTLLSGDEHKKDPFKMAFEQLWEQWADPFTDEETNRYKKKE